MRAGLGKLFVYGTSGWEHSSCALYCFVLDKHAMDDMPLQVIDESGLQASACNRLSQFNLLGYSISLALLA